GSRAGRAGGAERAEHHPRAAGHPHPHLSGGTAFTARQLHSRLWHVSGPVQISMTARSTNSTVSHPKSRRSRNLLSQRGSAVGIRFLMSEKVLSGDAGCSSGPCAAHPVRVFRLWRRGPTTLTL